jgi:hypothetical protein
MGYLMNYFKMRFLPFAFFLLLMAPALPAWAQGGYTLDDDLIYRINFGSADDVRVLLAKGANANAHSRQKESALNIAIERNDGESAGIALALIDKGADIEELDKNGNPPIVNAIRYKQTGVAKALIAKGADYHVKTSGSLGLTDFAKTNGDLESAKIIQDLLDKDTAYAETLRSPQRFNEFVRLYTLDSCHYQYWSYFLASRQAPEKDEQTKAKISQIKNRLSQMMTQLQKYYTLASINAMRKVAGQAVNEIYQTMDAMISNQNRSDNGIGKEEDEKARCDKIVAGLPINLMPVTLNNTNAPDNSPNLPPLPMDPNTGSAQPPASPNKSN